MAITRITQAQITRTLKAAQQAGIEPAKVEVDPNTGKISFWTGAFVKPVEMPSNDDLNPWDMDDEET